MKKQYKHVYHVQFRFMAISTFSVAIMLVASILAVNFYYKEREKMGAMIAITGTLETVIKLDQDPDKPSTELGNDWMYNRMFFFKIPTSGEGNYIPLSNCDKFHDFISDHFIKFKDAFDYDYNNIHVMSKENEGYRYYGGFDNTAEVNANIAIKNEIYLYISLVILGIYIILFILSFLAVRPLKKAIDSQNEFIGNASHELKTPLAIIKSNSQIIEEIIDQKDYEEAPKYLTNINRECSNMNNLIKDLMKISEMLTKKATCSLYNISSITLNTCLSYEVIAFENNIKFSYEVDPDIETFINKKDYLNMLTNILSNAVKYIDDKREIKFSLKLIKKNVVLTCYNSGCKLLESDKNRIFEKFFKVSPSDESHGLGMAMIKTICDTYNYDISVDYKTDLYFSISIKIKYVKPIFNVKKDNENI